MDVEPAAAFPLPESSASEREALLEAGRLTGLGELVRGFAHEVTNPLFARPSMHAESAE
jgi:C4-dicarboxylate-specific signal transduction histidine kinase